LDAYSYLFYSNRDGIHFFRDTVSIKYRKGNIMFSSIFSRIAAIFLVILVGTAARWRGVLTKDSTDGLCRVALELTLPFLYFYTLSTTLSPALFVSIAQLPLLAAGMILAAFFSSRMIAPFLHLNNDERKTFVFLCTFPNYGFLAIPLVFSLFGQQGLVMVFMFNLGISLLYWTLGIAILGGAGISAKGMFKNLANSATLGLALGITAGVCSLRIPDFILQAADSIGKASIPLALIVVGAILAHKDKKQRFAFSAVSALVIFRLVVMPLMALFIVNRVGHLPQMLRVLIVLQAAMPSASTTPILTGKFGGDTALAASGVFFTTLFSILTVPLFITMALR
ncbi:MAG: AEC family transporter, partial [Candidatus Omnitrophota bacterium]